MKNRPEQEGLESSNYVPRFQIAPNRERQLDRFMVEPGKKKQVEEF